MAGTTIRVRNSLGPEFAEYVETLNQLIDDAETFRAQMAAANGGAVAIPQLTAERLLSIQHPRATGGTTPADLNKDDGDTQTGTVGLALTDPLVVEVLDTLGVPIPGLVITWSASGDGSITATSTTNASGLAQASWQLGTGAGSQSATATLAGFGSVTFDATATAGPAAQIEIISGNNQSAEVSTELADPCVVKVTDQHGNAVEGETVTGLVTAGGGSLDDTSQDSDANGLVEFAWTLGSSAGANTFTATLDDVSGDPSVTFSASGQDTALTPDTLVAQANGTQTGKVAGAAASTITFRLTDGVTAVEGERIDFTSDSGTLDVDHDFTDSSGDVTVTPTSAAFPVGTMTITATLASNPSLTATATVATVAGTATKILVVTQPSSNAVSGVDLTQQPVFEVTDANGNRKLTGTGSNANIVLAKGTGSGTFHGTSPVQAVAGLVSPTDIDFTGAGTTNTITASCASPSLTSVTTDPVVLADPIAVAGQLQEPIIGTVVGGTIQIIGHVVDNVNVIVPNDTRSCTLVKATGPGNMTSNSPRNAVSGVATFSVSFDTEGDYTVTFTPSGLTPDTSSTITITVAPANNEPVGYVRFAQNDCQSLPVGDINGSATGLDGIWGFPSGSQDADITVFDPATFGLTAPSGNSRVWRVRYPTSQGIGQSSIKIFAWDNSITGTATGYSSIYLRWYFYLYGNAGTDFHMGVTQIKAFGYLGYGKTPAAGSVGNDMYWILSTGSVGNKTSLSLDTRQQNNVTRDIPGQVQVQVGQWYRMELAATLNTLGSANGTLKQWLTPINTGVANLWCNRTDMTFLTTSNTQKFWKWHWANIYGGGGSGNGGCRPEYYLIDDPYFSGVTP